MSFSAFFRKAALILTIFSLFFIVPRFFTNVRAVECECGDDDECGPGQHCGGTGQCGHCSADYQYGQGSYQPPYSYGQSAYPVFCNPAAVNTCQNNAEQICGNCAGGSGYCNATNGHCNVTCNGCSTGCTGGYGGYSDCDGCYKTRRCNSNSDIYQIAECGSCASNPPGNTPPACNATAPTIGTITTLSATSATVSWTPGANGNLQTIIIGANQTEVTNGCVGSATPACVVFNSTLPSTQNSYTTGNVLVPGTVYYYMVINYKDASCSSNSALKFKISSCALTPSSLTVELNETAPLTNSVTSSGEITSATYTSTDAGIASVTTPDSVSPYTTNVTGNALGTVTVNSSLHFTAPASNPACTSSSSVTVINPRAWWQTIDADVEASGDLEVNVPSGLYFGLPGPGGYPGVPSYSGTTDLTTLNSSQLGWLAQSAGGSPKVYSYDFFARQIPQDVVDSITTIPSASVPGTYFESGGNLSSGYYWYKYDGSGGIDLTISSAVNLSGTGRKIVLLVENGNLNIDGNINLTDGSEFFGVFVNGSTTVAPTVTSLEGIYLSDSSFSTGASATQLHVRGSVAAYAGVSLQRDYGDTTNTTTPAEVFEYGPDQIMLFPTKIGTRKLNWKEVAP